MTPVRRESLHVVALVAIVAWALWFFVLPRGFSLHLPIAYGEGDSLFDAHFVKRILTSGWFPWASEHLGAPFGSSDYDMPEAQWMHYVVIKAIGLFSGDWVFVTNAFVLSGFFFATIAAYFVLRWMQLEPVWAGLGAILFAFLPYHFLRLAPLTHLFLAAYWNVPIAVWLALRAWPDDAPSPTSSPTRMQRAALAGAVIAVGAGGIYYAFFACFLITVAGLTAAIANGAWRAALPATRTVIAICVVVAIQLWPSVQHWRVHGSNPEAAARHPAESEIYGLKPIQVLVPQPSHPLPQARAFAERYNKSSPLSNENQSAALGFVASVGLLLLLAALFMRLARGGGRAKMPEKLALLTAASLLLAVVGGAGALFAWMVSPLIRAYNRISVFIGFMSIAAALLALEALLRHIAREWKSRHSVALLAASVIGLFGLWDQSIAFDQKRVAPAFNADREFIRKAEAALPAGTSVYQLPYHPYPEAGPVKSMADYDPFRGYLHSSRLRWSYGGMKARTGDRWLRALAALSVEKQLAIAAESGFGAVYLDRRAFDDRGAAIEAELRNRIGEPIATHGSGDLVIYRLTPTGKTPVPLENFGPIAPGIERSNAQAAPAPQPAPVPAPSPPSTAPSIDPAALAAGIEFKNQNFPAYIKSVQGMAGAEEFGRWTSGSTARFTFTKPLPRDFKLRLEVVNVFGPNAGKPLKVSVGDWSGAAVVATMPQTIELAVRTSTPADSIELSVAQPTSPAQLGMSADTRMLGVALRRMSVTPP